MDMEYIQSIFFLEHYIIIFLQHNEDLILKIETCMSTKPAYKIPWHLNFQCPLNLSLCDPQVIASKYRVLHMMDHMCVINSSIFIKFCSQMFNNHNIE